MSSALGGTHYNDPVNLCQICRAFVVPGKKDGSGVEKVKHSCGTLGRVREAAKNGCEFCSLANLVIRDAINWWMFDLSYSDHAGTPVVLEMQTHNSSHPASTIEILGGTHPAARPHFSAITRGRKRDYLRGPIGSEIVLTLAPDITAVCRRHQTLAVI